MTRVYKVDDIDTNDTRWAHNSDVIEDVIRSHANFT